MLGRDVEVLGLEDKFKADDHIISDFILILVNQIQWLFGMFQFLALFFWVSRLPRFPSFIEVSSFLTSLEKGFGLVRRGRLRHL